MERDYALRERIEPDVGRLIEANACYVSKCKSAVTQTTAALSTAVSALKAKRGVQNLLFVGGHLEIEKSFITLATPTYSEFFTFFYRHETDVFAVTHNYLCDASNLGDKDARAILDFRTQQWSVQGLADQMDLMCKDVIKRLKR